MKITVVGMGYVGLSIAILLSQKHEVITTDINKKKISQINKKKSPIKDNYIIEFLNKKKLNLKGTLSNKKAFLDSNYVIVCTPTNFDEKTNNFDTSSVEKVISNIIRYNRKSNIVIKSTVPVGFTEKIKKVYKKDEIFFSPEFLREDFALRDNLYPSRIVIGDPTKPAKRFAKILAECSKIQLNKIKIHEITSKEAEAVKLFSNAYLAMRVSFFNELDTFSEESNLLSKNIIDAVCDDNRIGNLYNNPSFGYGGYCLPKDTKQLLSSYHKIPNELIRATIKSNKTRKKFIFNSIMKKKPYSVGIYRLIMKKNSENFRESAVIDLINLLKEKKVKIYLFEPFIKKNSYKGITVMNNFEKFTSSSDVIIANRMSDKLKKTKKEIYSRDIFRKN